MTLKNQAGGIASTLIAYPETRAAFARAWKNPARMPLLSSEAYAAAVVKFDEDWQSVLRVPIDGELAFEAGRNAATYGIRGYDSVHLTSALRLQNSDDLLFSTWDKALADAAVAAGLSLAHEVTS
jgi:predicted nucleic acid-binding protein